MSSISAHQATITFNNAFRVHTDMLVALCRQHGIRVEERSGGTSRADLRGAISQQFDTLPSALQVELLTAVEALAHAAAALHKLRQPEVLREIPPSWRNASRDMADRLLRQ